MSIKSLEEQLKIKEEEAYDLGKQIEDREKETKDILCKKNVALTEAFDLRKQINTTKLHGVTGDDFFIRMYRVERNETFSLHVGNANGLLEVYLSREILLKFKEIVDCLVNSSNL